MDIIDMIILISIFQKYYSVITKIKFYVYNYNINKKYNNALNSA